jgi:diaminobutyrate-2-oxoglutarate transaminase
MLRHYWGDSGFQRRLDARCTQLRAILDGWRRDLPEKITRISVQGLFAGLQLRSADHAKAVQQDCFEQGLIVELCGPLADTIKLLPPIVIDEPELVSGLRKLMNALARHG